MRRSACILAPTENSAVGTFAQTLANSREKCWQIRANYHFKRLDLTSTRDLLGYAPQDDAFAIFSETLDQWQRD
jgi:hypothetical protein